MTAIAAALMKPVVRVSVALRTNAVRMVAAQQDLVGQVGHVRDCLIPSGLTLTLFGVILFVAMFAKRLQLIPSIIVLPGPWI